MTEKSVFQSSSYWRMAEKRGMPSLRNTSVKSFNPHHTGEWLKRSQDKAVRAIHSCFNPHHTGEWLKRQPSSHNSTGQPVLFQSSSYWRMAEKTVTLLERIVEGKRFQSSSYWRMAEKEEEQANNGQAKTCFNPHHTGEWLKRAK